MSSVTQPCRCACSDAPLRPGDRLVYGGCINRDGLWTGHQNMRTPKTHFYCSTCDRWKTIGVGVRCMRVLFTGNCCSATPSLKRRGDSLFWCCRRCGALEEYDRHGDEIPVYPFICQKEPAAVVQSLQAVSQFKGKGVISWGK
mgnify:CR=1 FL=1